MTSAADESGAPELEDKRSEWVVRLVSSLFQV